MCLCDHLAFFESACTSQFYECEIMIHFVLPPANHLKPLYSTRLKNVITRYIYAVKQDTFICNLAKLSYPNTCVCTLLSLSIKCMNSNTEFWFQWGVLTRMVPPVWYLNGRSTFLCTIKFGRRATGGTSVIWATLMLHYKETAEITQNKGGMEERLIFKQAHFI